MVPTSDDPTGEEIVVNPASSAGRPIWEVHISNVEMIGVIPYDKSVEEAESQSFFSTAVGKTTLGLGIIVIAVAGYAAFTRTKEDEPDAILLDLVGEEID